jgi:RNA polymerase sigma factor (sigma-70 family)
MAGILSNSAARLIGTLFGEGSLTGMTDAQLLDRFVSQHDASAEYAFEVLVQRHGPMVMGVCRSALGDLHDAEDAFQATFLVLARRASSLQNPANLGPWLHGVARRTAQKARARRSRLERLIHQAATKVGIGAAAGPDRSAHDAEAVELLHEEIGRLPEKYRTPVVLCDLEGLTREEAAKQLGWPIGTLGVRLMRARERLRGRLTHRGLAPAGQAILPLGLPAEPLSGSLVVQTVRAAASFATGAGSTYGAIPSQVTAIAVGVLRTMSIKKLTIGAAAILGCMLIAAGSVVLALQAPTKRPNTGNKTAPAQDDKAKPSKSILTNGGFERGDSQGVAPADWKKGAAVPRVMYLWDRNEAHGGKASLHLRKTVERYFPIAQWSQEVKRQGNAKRLKVVAFIKARKMGKAVLDVQFVDRNGQWSHQWVAYIGAKEDGDLPVTHAWKKYEAIVAIPDGTDKLIIAPQIYGPGDVWFDDVEVEYTDAEPTEPVASLPPDDSPKANPDEALADVADVPFEERKAGDDAKKRYFLIGPTVRSDPPADGYRLLVVLPGGDGGADFQPFVRRIAKYALPPDYLVAQLVAVAWSPEQARDIVWPTAADRLPGVEFTTEDFVDAVIADVMRTNKIDARFIFTLGWSSGGPAAYATALPYGGRPTGSFVAMSVFKPERHRPSVKDQGHPYYLLHSPEDSLIPIAMVRTAVDELRQSGARVELRTYDGGHGWHGDVFGEIRRGVRWLEANHSAPPS